MSARLLLWGSLHVAMLSRFSSGVRRGGKASHSVVNASEVILGFKGVQARTAKLMTIDAVRDPCPNGVILIATRHGKAIHNVAEGLVDLFIRKPSKSPGQLVLDAINTVVNQLGMDQWNPTNDEAASLQLEAIGEKVKHLIEANDASVGRLKKKFQKDPPREAAGEAMKKLAILRDTAYLDAPLAEQGLTATIAAVREGLLLVDQNVGVGPRMVFVSPLKRTIETAWKMWGNADNAVKNIPDWAKNLLDIPKFLVDQMGEKRTGYPCDTRSPSVARMLSVEPQIYPTSAATYALTGYDVAFLKKTLITAVAKQSEGRAPFFRGGALFAHPPGTENLNESAWTFGSEWTCDRLEPDDTSLRTRVKGLMEAEFLPLLQDLGASGGSAIADKTFAFVSHKGWLRELERQFLKERGQKVYPNKDVETYSNLETRIYCLEPSTLTLTAVA